MPLLAYNGSSGDEADGDGGGTCLTFSRRSTVPRRRRLATPDSPGDDENMPPAPATAAAAAARSGGLSKLAQAAAGADARSPRPTAAGAAAAQLSPHARSAASSSPRTPLATPHAAKQVPQLLDLADAYTPWLRTSTKPHAPFLVHSGLSSTSVLSSASTLSASSPGAASPQAPLEEAVLAGTPPPAAAAAAAAAGASVVTPLLCGPGAAKAPAPAASTGGASSSSGGSSSQGSAPLTLTRRRPPHLQGGASWLRTRRVAGALASSSSSSSGESGDEADRAGPISAAGGLQHQELAGAATSSDAEHASSSSEGSSSDSGASSSWHGSSSGDGSDSGIGWRAGGRGRHVCPSGGSAGGGCERRITPGSSSSLVARRRRRRPQQADASPLPHPQQPGQSSDMEQAACAAPSGSFGPANPYVEQYDLDALLLSSPAWLDGVSSNSSRGGGSAATPARTPAAAGVCREASAAAAESPAAVMPSSCYRPGPGGPWQHLAATAGGAAAGLGAMQLPGDGVLVGGSTPGASRGGRSQAGCRTAPPKAPSTRTFARVRQQLSQTLYDQWNAQVFDGGLPSGLPLVWNPRLTATAGQVVDDGSANASKASREERVPVRLELSSKVLDCEARLRTTLAHEMCHVAAWAISREFRQHHGPAFWAWARRFEARVAGIRITTCHSYEVHAPFRWQCTNADCGKQYHRHKRSIDTARHVCSRCSGRLAYLGKFSRGGQLIASSLAPPTPLGGAAAASAAFAATPPRGGNVFSSFVKQHFATTKRSLPAGTPHKDVMARLAADYKQQKVAAAAAPQQQPEAAAGGASSRSSDAQQHAAAGAGGGSSSSGLEQQQAEADGLSGFMQRLALAADE